MYEVFNAITMDSSDLDVWCKSFMLARCVLANPARGGRSNWRETLKTVRTRIRRWQADDIMGLWSEVVEEDRLTQRRRKPKKIAAESLRAANSTRGQRSRTHNIMYNYNRQRVPVGRRLYIYRQKKSWSGLSRHEKAPVCVVVEIHQQRKRLSLL